MSEVNKAGYVYVLGVDPGTTTGLAIVRYDPGNLGKPMSVWADQLPWQDAASRVEWALGRMRGHLDDGSAARAVAACEKYTINAQTAQRGQAGADDALGMIGVVRRNCELTKVEFLKPEQASAAKNLVKDEVLKLLGMYGPGMVHANDAYRHAVLFAIKHKIMNLRWMVEGVR